MNSEKFHDQLRLHLRALGLLGPSATQTRRFCTAKENSSTALNTRSPQSGNETWRWEVRQGKIWRKEKNRKAILMTLDFVFFYLYMLRFPFLLLSLFVFYTCIFSVLWLTFMGGFFSWFFPVIILAVLLWPLLSVWCIFYNSKYKMSNSMKIRARGYCVIQKLTHLIFLCLPFYLHLSVFGLGWCWSIRLGAEEEAVVENQGWHLRNMSGTNNPCVIYHHKSA